MTETSHATRIRSALADCRFFERLLPATFLSGILAFLLYLLVLAPPAEFSAPSVVKIHTGETIREAVEALEEKHIVRSPYLLEGLVRLMGGNRRMRAGTYFFSEPVNILTVGIRLVVGDFELKPVRVYVPEGANSMEIAQKLSKLLAPFETEAFLALAREKEGYLYPDTYFFYPAQEPELIVQAMQGNFAANFAPVEEHIRTFGKTPYEALIMASLLEREAPKTADRKIIAGILWKRTSLGMPLQVDAAFGYVLEKSLTELTTEDLTKDSPYNTYTNKGLPPTPIGNPSAEALLAAVTPTKTNYLYYLSDRYGGMHYAATYEQHLANIRKYLR